MNASQLQVIVSKLYSLLFGAKICGSKFWQIFCGYFFAYHEAVTIPSRLIFAFAIFALHTSTILMVQKEELSTKSSELLKKHAHDNKLKSRGF